MAYPNKNFKLADLFFYKDEESVMRISILRNIQLQGDTYEQAFETEVKILERGFDTCEWMVNFRDMPTGKTRLAVESCIFIVKSKILHYDKYKGRI